jgi:hypothetical protein
LILGARQKLSRETTRRITIETHDVRGPQAVEERK